MPIRQSENSSQLNKYDNSIETSDADDDSCDDIDEFDEEDGSENVALESKVELRPPVKAFLDTLLMDCAALFETLNTPITVMSTDNSQAVDETTSDMDDILTEAGILPDQKAKDAQGERRFDAFGFVLERVDPTTQGYLDISFGTQQIEQLANQDPSLALRLAASENSIVHVSSLIERGAVADGSDHNRELSPVHLAARHGCTQFLKKISKHGEINSRAPITNTIPLHYAAFEGHVGTVRWLLSNGARVELTDCQGLTALHFAAIRGHAAIIDILLKHNSDRNATDTTLLWTPLHCACMGGHVDAVQALLQPCNGLNSQDAWGRTPLHLAAFAGSILCVRTLLANGAILDRKDANGSIPLDLAQLRHHTDVCLLLDTKRIVEPNEDDKYLKNQKNSNEVTVENLSESQVVPAGQSAEFIDQRRVQSSKIHIELTSTDELLILADSHTQVTDIENTQAKDSSETWDIDLDQIVENELLDDKHNREVNIGNLQDLDRKAEDPTHTELHQLADTATQLLEELSSIAMNTSRSREKVLQQVLESSKKQEIDIQGNIAGSHGKHERPWTYVPKLRDVRKLPPEMIEPFDPQTAQHWGNNEVF